MCCTMMWTLPVLVLGLVALVVRDLGLVVFVDPCNLYVHWHAVLITVLITVSD